MSYYMSRIIDMSFGEAVTLVKEKLDQEVIAVLTEIDVHSIFKEKLGMDIKKYKILGVCEPQLANKALQVESKIGTLMPCNIIVQEIEDGSIEVASIDPVASMVMVKNPEIKTIAEKMQEKLQRVIESL